MTRSSSGRRSTSSDLAGQGARPRAGARPRLRAAALLLPLLALLIALPGAGCRRPGGDRDAKRATRPVPSDTARAHAESQYELLQASLQLAQKDKPYLIFDWSEPALNVMLKGAIV